MKREGCTIKFEMKLKSGSSYLMCARIIPTKESFQEKDMIYEDDQLKNQEKEKKTLQVNGKTEEPTNEASETEQNKTKQWKLYKIESTKHKY